MGPKKQVQYSVEPLELHGHGGSELYAGREVIQVSEIPENPTKKDRLKTVIECYHYDIVCVSLIVP